MSRSIRSGYSSYSSASGYSDGDSDSGVWKTVDQGNNRSSYSDRRGDQGNNRSSYSDRRGGLRGQSSFMHRTDVDDEYEDSYSGSNDDYGDDYASYDEYERGEPRRYDAPYDSYERQGSSREMHRMDRKHAATPGLGDKKPSGRQSSYTSRQSSFKPDSNHDPRSFATMNHDLATKNEPPNPMNRKHPWVDDDELYYDGRDFDAHLMKNRFNSVVVLLSLIQILIYIRMSAELENMSRDRRYLTFTGPSLILFGAKSAVKIQFGEWWRLFTAQFLHTCTHHLLCNVFIQFTLGTYLNALFGAFEWTIIYFYAGANGLLVSCIYLPESVSVGSSFAMMGTIAAWLVWVAFRWRRYHLMPPFKMKILLSFIIVWILYGLYLTFIDMMDRYAMFGSIVQGMLAGAFLFRNELPDSKQNKLLISGVLATSLLILLSCIMIVLQQQIAVEARRPLLYGYED